MTGIGACASQAGVRVWTSPVIDHGNPDTLWVLVAWNSTEPEGTTIEVQYRIDGGPWVSVLNEMEINATGQTFQIRARLESTVDDAFPTLDEIAVIYEETN